MFIRTIVLLCGVLATGSLLVSTAGADETEPGELKIDWVTPLRPETLLKLRDLASRDAEARAIVEQVAAEAMPLLDAKPDPLEAIEYEGLVNTDPRRLKTVAKLRQMSDVACLIRFWQATGNEQAARTLRRFTLAWTAAYRPTGNDVNENKLVPLLVAYHAQRSIMSADEVSKVDAWVEQFGQLHADAVRDSKHFTNRYTKHVRLLALAGLILARDRWVDAAQAGVKRFVIQSLRADGASEDLERRDTLTYHASSLTPVIELAMLAGDSGPELYRWTSPAGGSIKKSVDFVVPYAEGVKQREEWRHTKVALDRRRAEAGLEKYRPGRLYEPKDALELMELASYFDPELLRVVRRLADHKAERFPTWQTLINQAAAEDGQKR